MEDNNYLYLKIGLYNGAQIALLLINTRSLTKSKIGKIPFFIQLIWLINCAVWNQSLLQEDTLGLQIASGIIDTFVKCLVIYFLSVRILVIGNLLKRSQVWWNVFLFLTFFTLILGNFNQFIVAKYEEEMSIETITFLNCIYYSNDIMLSVVEIYTVWIFIMAKYNISNLRSCLETLKNLNLLRMGFVILIFALINTTTFFVSIFVPEFDPDLNYNGMLACIKYHYACEFTVDLFKKTMGATSSLTSQRKSTVTRGKSADHLRAANSIPVLPGPPIAINEISRSASML
jgi:hypothetical protein